MTTLTQLGIFLTTRDSTVRDSTIRDMPQEIKLGKSIVLIRGL